MSKVNVEFGATLDDLKSGVDEVNSTLDGVKSHLDSLSEGFRTLAEIAGVTLTFAGLEAEFQSLAEFANQMQDAQARMGGSLESITTLNGVAAMAGVSFKSLERSVEEASLNLQKSTKDAFNPAAAGLKALGLSASGLVNLPVDEWMAKVADRLSQYNSSLTLTSNVQQAFGRGFTEILPLLMEGGDHFREVSEAVRKAQDGLAAALPGLTETQDKLTLLSLGSRNFAAQVFSTLKPAIDGAIDWFTRLSGSITSDNIRDAANRIGNALIDVAQSVAEFMVKCGLSVDLLKGKLASFGQIDLGYLDGWAARAVHAFQTTGMESEAAWKQFHDRWNTPIPLKIDLFGGGSSGESAAQDLKGQIEAIGAAADAARARLNRFVPTSGSWAAVAQDISRLTTETLGAAESFTKLNAAAADNGARQRLAAQATAIEAEVQAEQAKYQRIKAIIDADAAAFRITQGEKAIFLETALEQQYQAELQAESQKLGIWARGTREYEAALKEMGKLTQIYQKEMLQIVEQSQKEMTATITQGLQTITGAFNSQLRGLLAGTTSWAAAMKNIAADLFLKMIELGEQWAVKHAATMIADSLLGKTQAATDVAARAAAEAAKTEAVVAGAAARTAAETAGNSAGIATQLASAVQSIGIDAGKVFAGVFGFLAPVMGPAAAGPAAASEAAAMAGGLAPLAVGAWEIPSVMPALLHPGEMVMPATFASGFRSAVSGGGEGGGGGAGGGPPINLSFSNFIGNQQFINQIMPQLARAFGNYQRLNPSAAGA